MKKLVILTISFLLMLNSCHQASKTQKEDSSSYNWNNAQSYISDDERFEFMVLADSGKANGLILLDKNSGTIYHLDQVAAASGVKYADEDGFTFWTKGDDFIWSNHMDMIASGKVKHADLSENHTNEQLVSNPVDSITFNKVLQLQGIEFNVSAIRNNNGIIELTVSTSGLETDNSKQKQTVEGNVVGAEVADLNSDGSPELLIYTQSDGSGSYGDVLAYSVNNKKSLSQVYFPPVSENPEISTGYMGHDEFRVEGNSLTQRFPVYNEGDTNANPTGGIRKITYKLVDGEASRRFEVKDIITPEQK